MQIKLSLVTRAITCALLALLMTRPGNARLIGLMVTGIHENIPSVAGRYLSVDCSLKNGSTEAVTINQVVLVIRNAGGNDVSTDYGPSQPKFPVVLPPGQTLTVRRFPKVDRPGKYTCSVAVKDAAGREIAVAPGGPAASLQVRVWTSATLPQATCDVSDPQPGHVYHPGDTISVKVTPVITGGIDLADNVGAITVTPGAKPHSLSDSSTALDLMRESLPTNGKEGKRTGFVADFYGADDAHKYVDMTVEFKRPCAVSSLRITGQNLNSEYGESGCEIEAMSPDGSQAMIPVANTQEGSLWTVAAGQGESVIVSRLRLRVHTPWKLNVTSIAIQGRDDSSPSVAARSSLSFRWVDDFGGELTPSQTLVPFQSNAIRSPEKLSAGYYGLEITSRFEGIPERRQEYGFVVLPNLPAVSLHDARLSVVHSRLDDAYVGQGWSKTLMTPFYNSTAETLDTSAWQRAIDSRAALGLTELPLVAGGEWKTDPTMPVTPEELRKLKVKMRQYFKAQPTPQYWELGLEESLGWRGHRNTWPYYWSNLEAKARVVREAANEVRPGIKLVYQIVELDTVSAEDFLKSGASKYFDVLSLHPYAWSDFPPPERWMPPFLEKIRGLMTQYGAVKPIWFTEIGAPLDGNPGGFFGYPSKPAHDRGLGRDEHAGFLVKCHLVGFQQGVAKIFWYTYSDSGVNPEYAEDFFGMIDARGYPKPSYAAYCTMSREISCKPFATAKTLAGGIQLCRFSGQMEDCVAVWTYPALKRDLPLSEIGIDVSKVKAVVDMLGKPEATGAGIAVSEYPVYVTVAH